MVIGVCAKCGYQDLIDDSIENNCPRCSGKMESLGIKSTDWNSLTNEEKQTSIKQINEPSVVAIDTTTDVAIIKPPEIQPSPTEPPTSTESEEPDTQNNLNQIDNNTQNSQANRPNSITKKKVVTTEVKHTSVSETNIKEESMVDDPKCVVASRLNLIGGISQLLFTITGIFLLFILFDDYHDRWIYAILSCVACCLVGYINRIVCSCFAVITENQYRQLRYREKLDRQELDSVESIVERPLNFG